MAQRFHTLGKLIQWLLAIALLPGLWILDDWLSDERTAGYERKTLRGVDTRLKAQPDAEGAILLGSSTSRDWIKIAWLPRLLREDAADVIPGHINGCQQGCTWTEVRRLLDEDRHFRVALYGTNQFQMCEQEHSKRVLQHRTLVPTSDTTDVWRAYLHTERPMRWIGRYLFGALSGAYADTTAVQRRVGQPIVKRNRVREEQRFIHRELAPAPDRVCAYSDEDVAYKTELSRQLYADLSRLADRVYIMLLPDRSLAGTSPDEERAWQAHRALQRQLVDEHDNLWLLDLTEDQDYTQADFKDPVHLHRDRYRVQRGVLSKQLHEGGHLEVKR